MSGMTDPGNQGNTGMAGRPALHGQRYGKACCGEGSHLVIGLFLVGLGTLFLLDRLGVMDASDLFSYWPAALLAIGVGMVIRGGRHLLGGFVMVTMGGVFLAQRLGLIEMGMRQLWPVLLIAMGIFVIVSSVRTRRSLGLGRGERQ